MGKHEYTKFDRARDEMMSHVIRCDVLDAEMQHRTEWLEETMQYMAERYPMLSDLELTKLEMIGKQFIKPAIPHGRGNTARTRDQNLDELVEDELSTETEPAESPEKPEDAPAEAPAPAGESKEEAGESELVVA